jgi:hypothetical protein
MIIKLLSIESDSRLTHCELLGKKGSIGTLRSKLSFRASIRCGLKTCIEYQECGFRKMVLLSNFKQILTNRFGAEQLNPSSGYILREKHPDLQFDLVDQ